MKNIVLGIMAAILVLYITPQTTRQNIPYVDTAVTEVEDRVEGVLNSAVDSVRDSIKGFLKEKTQEALDQVNEEVQDQIDEL